jgi:hypothetical protein
MVAGVKPEGPCPKAAGAELRSENVCSSPETAAVEKQLNPSSSMQLLATCPLLPLLWKNFLPMIFLG